MWQAYWPGGPGMPREIGGTLRHLLVTRENEETRTDLLRYASAEAYVVG